MNLLAKPIRLLWLWTWAWHGDRLLDKWERSVRCSIIQQKYRSLPFSTPCPIENYIKYKKIRVAKGKNKKTVSLGWGASPSQTRHVLQTLHHSYTGEDCARFALLRVRMVRAGILPLPSTLYPHPFKNISGIIIHKLPILAASNVFFPKEGRIRKHEGRS